MSRQNKVNPGMYTQRGRLSQDDAARELRKQSAIASPHTWQPVNTRRPRLALAGYAALAKERPADHEKMDETSSDVKTRPASRVTRKTTVAKRTSPKAKATTAKAKTAGTRKAKRAAGNTKTRKAP